MVTKREQTRALISVGLTNNEAKVLLAILNSERATAKMISKISEMDRSNVYKTLNRLEEKGVIIKVVGIPNSYVSMRMEQIISILMEAKKEEYQKIQAESKKLVQHFENYKKNNRAAEEFVKILPGKDATYTNWIETLRTIQNTYDLVTSGKREKFGSQVAEICVSLLEKGVKIRVIFDRSDHDDNEFLLNAAQYREVFKYPNFQSRFSFSPIKPYMNICDNKIAAILLDNTKYFNTSRVLWTNNSGIIRTCKQRFDLLWNLAMEYQP